MLTLFFAAALATAPPSPAPQAYDVLISAGHEGRPQSCPHFPKHHCNLGTAGERQWTPVVADAATRALRADGLTVAREPADFEGRFNVKAAIFIHFDGNDTPCSTGASIGYHHASDKAAADAWRHAYGAVFPFRFMNDNFTNSLQDYYGFRQLHASDGALVLELAEITCPRQRAWIAPRLQWAGQFIARFVERLIRRE